MSKAAAQLDLLQHHEWEFLPEEREAFRTFEPLVVSQWAERHVYLPSAVTSRGGYYRNDNAPYLAEVVDDWLAPWVRRVVFCAASQTGKTLAGYLCLLYAIERLPGPMLLVMADQDSARKVSSDYLQPILRASPKLRRLLSPDPDDTASYRIKFRNGARLYIVWVTSESKLKTFGIETGMGDEVDDWPESSGTSGDPDGMFDARQSTYPYTAKRFYVSSPKMDFKGIWTKLQECQVVKVRLVPCPQCGAEQRLVWPQIIYPKDTNADAVEADGLAAYECAACGGHWDDAETNHAEAAGRWQAVERPYVFDKDHWHDPFPAPLADEPARPVSIGRHLAAWYSHTVSLSRVAARWIRAEKHPHVEERREKLREWTNNFPAHPYAEVVRVENPGVAALLGFITERPAGLAPDWTTAIVASVDMQKVGFWFNVWAFERDLTRRRKALVNHGYLPDWQALHEFIFDTRYRVDGRPGLELPVWRAPLDTGGGEGHEEWSRSAEAYSWLRNRPRQGVAWGIKGQPRRPNQPRVWHKVIDKMPGAKGGRIQGGLVLWYIDGPRFKDEIFTELAVALTCALPDCGAASPRAVLAERGGMCPQCGHPVPGWEQSVFLHSAADPAWAKQMLAEEKQRQKSGVYEWVQVGKDNHYLDCAVYAWAAASPEWAGGVAVLAEPGAAPPAPPPTPQPKRSKLW